ncbi:hypothetical protein Zm00014a_027150, partial [Zea mays]
IYVCTTVEDRPGTVVRSLSTEPKVLDRCSLFVKYRGKSCLGYPFLRSHSCGSRQQLALGLSFCLCLYNCLVPCTIMQCAVQSYIQHVVENGALLLGSIYYISILVLDLQSRDIALSLGETSYPSIELLPILSCLHPAPFP